MKPLHLIMAAIAAIALAGFIYTQPNDPADEMGEAIEGAVDATSRAIKDAAD